jgi:MIP family channel proteins
MKDGNPDLHRTTSVYSKPQKLAAEFVGTFALVIFAAGALCADQFLRSSGQPGLGALGIALAPGLALAAMVVSLVQVSGAHFNPAVSIGLWVTRRMSTFDLVAYWVAQLAGAIAAAYIVRLAPFDVWSAVQLGSPSIASGITRAEAMLCEGLLTFLWVLVYFATVPDKRGGLRAGAALGMTVTAGILFGGPFTGAAMNPARAFGPSLVVNHWTNQGIYWIGPLGGGVVAGWIHELLFTARTRPQ